MEHEQGNTLKGCITPNTLKQMRSLFLSCGASAAARVKSSGDCSWGFGPPSHPSRLLQPRGSRGPRGLEFFLKRSVLWLPVLDTAQFRSYLHTKLKFNYLVSCLLFSFILVFGFLVFFRLLGEGWWWGGLHTDYLLVCNLFENWKKLKYISALKAFIRFQPWTNKKQ